MFIIFNLGLKWTILYVIFVVSVINLYIFERKRESKIEDEIDKFINFKNYQISKAKSLKGENFNDNKNVLGYVKSKFTKDKYTVYRYYISSDIMARPNYEKEARKDVYVDLYVVEDIIEDVKITLL